MPCSKSTKEAGSNRPFGEWTTVFPDAAMTLAAVDRLVHHAVILEMNVQSYRQRSAAIRQKQRPSSDSKGDTKQKETTGHPNCRAISHFICQPWRAQVMLWGCSSSPKPMPPRYRAVFNQEGELSAVIELRRRFPGVTDNAKARACARSIAGWTPLPAQLRPVTRLRPRKRANQQAS